MEKLQERRVVPKFDEEENKLLNKNIKNTVSYITSQIHQCENAISSLSFLKTNCEIQKQIKDNIKLYLTSKFNNFARHFKYNQELYIRKYKELGGEDLDKIYKNQQNNDNYLLKMEKIDNLKSRDSDLNQLLESMNNLTSTFKDLKNLVVEQGTILDRIDYNIDTAKDNTAKGKQHLINAENLQKNNCFRNVMLMLFLFIFFEGILMIFKFL